MIKSDKKILNPYKEVVNAALIFFPLALKKNKYICKGNIGHITSFHLFLVFFRRNLVLFNRPSSLHLFSEQEDTIMSTVLKQ